MSDVSINSKSVGPTGNFDNAAKETQKGANEVDIRIHNEGVLPENIAKPEEKFPTQGEIEFSANPINNEENQETATANKVAAEILNLEEQPQTTYITNNEHTRKSDFKESENLENLEENETVEDEVDLSSLGLDDLENLTDEEIEQLMAMALAKEGQLEEIGDQLEEAENDVIQDINEDLGALEQNEEEIEGKDSLITENTAEKLNKKEELSVKLNKSSSILDERSQIIQENKDLIETMNLSNVDSVSNDPEVKQKIDELKNFFKGAKEELRGNPSTEAQKALKKIEADEQKFNANPIHYMQTTIINGKSLMDMDPDEFKKALESYRADVFAFVPRVREEDKKEESGVKPPEQREMKKAEWEGKEAPKVKKEPKESELSMRLASDRLRRESENKTDREIKQLDEGIQRLQTIIKESVLKKEVEKAGIDTDQLAKCLEYATQIKEAMSEMPVKKETLVTITKTINLIDNFASKENIPALSIIRDTITTIHKEITQALGSEATAGKSKNPDVRGTR